MSSPNEARDLEAEWARLERSLTTAGERLRMEVAECGRIASAALTPREFGSPSATAAGDGESDPIAFVVDRSRAGRAGLVDPLKELEERGPIRRLLAAIDAYRTALSEIVRRTPEFVETSGTALAGHLTPVAGDTLSLRVAGRWTADRRAPLRTALERSLLRAEARQQAVETRLTLELLRATQDLREGWRHRRSELDQAAAGDRPAGDSPSDASAPEPLPQPTDANPPARPAAAAPDDTSTDNDVVESSSSGAEPSPAQRVAAATEHAMGDLTALSRELRADVARRLARGFLLGYRGTPRSARRARTAHLEYLTAQLSSVERELAFERDLFEAEQRLLTAGLVACRNLAAERDALVAGVDTLSRWLSARLAAEPATNVLPTPPHEVVPASSRERSLANETRAIVTQGLPRELSVLRRLGQRPARRLKWRVLEPAELATEAFEGVCETGIGDLFATAERDHLALFHTIERARQVIEYGTTEADDDNDDAIEHEALENARALLLAERDHLPDSTTSERQRMIGLLATFFREYRILLLRTRIGALAHLGSLDAKQAFATGARAVANAVVAGAAGGMRMFRYLYRRFLVAIKWIPEEETAASEVTRRPYLPPEFIADLSALDLPRIYRRLFQFEAVEDQRFLIGRENELAAIAEARELWEAGRPVAILIVGARGSGKTSLINCAIRSSLDGLDLHRGEIGRRTLTPRDVREVVAEVVGIDDPSRIEAALADHRQVVVLEELERSFLREIGGFDAVRELQRLIAATSRTTLWMIACNQRAFALLNRVTGLADSFSHRIDAASVSKDVLREAILVRHNLSGLRLRFRPSSRSRSRIERWVPRMRRGRDPEDFFFERLAEESGGVFRTAFELWMGRVESQHPGTLDLRPLTEPEIGPLIDELDQDDLFALLATMQHGSITAEEHARVFQQTLAASQAEMDELFSRELIEEDPLRPGFRIRPPASRVARDALHRHNLA